MAIDMHCHWLPPALAERLADRTAPPRIVTDADGSRWLVIPNERLAFGADYSDPDRRLAAMRADGVDRQVISLPGLFGIDSLPAPEAEPLLALYNRAAADLAAGEPDRFRALAALPLADIERSVAVLDDAVARDGAAGAILPADAFRTRHAAERIEPVLRAIARLGVYAFIHPGPLPGARPREAIAADTADPADNAGQRHISLAVQHRLSEVMVTLLMGGLMDDLPDLRVHVANLGGSFPFLLSRIDHVAETRGLPRPEPARLAGRLVVDCASFDTAAIDLAIAALSPDAVVLGSDWPVFSARRAMAGLGRLDAGIRQRVAEDNARRFLRA
ncbi:MAG: amidohydrolase family protein [Azospirillaceae bacterium]